MTYPVAVAVLALLAVLLSWVGLAWLGPLLFPPAVALWRVRGERGRAYGLIAAAFAAGLVAGVLMTSAPAAGVAFGVVMAMFAAMGLMLGASFIARRPYGQVLARVVAAMYAISCAGLVFGWDEGRAMTRDMLEQSINQLRTAPADNGAAPADTTVESTSAPEGEPAAAGNTESLVPAVEDTPPGARPTAADIAEAEEWTRWLIENWAALAFGLTFLPIMLMGLALLGVTEWVMRRADVGMRPKGDLRGVRVPDWVVWLAIVVALLWFLDRWYYPSEPARIVAWNGAFILAGIYWLAGMAILFHTVTALRLPPLLVLVFLALFFLTVDAHLLLSGVGLFDTWVDFRGRLDRALAARRKRRDDDNDT